MMVVMICLQAGLKERGSKGHLTIQATCSLRASLAVCGQGSLRRCGTSCVTGPANGIVLDQQCSGSAACPGCHVGTCTSSKEGPSPGAASAVGGELKAVKALKALKALLATYYIEVVDNAPKHRRIAWYLILVLGGVSGKCTRANTHLATLFPVQYSIILVLLQGVGGGTNGCGDGNDGNCHVTDLTTHSSGQ